jgi:hypothetical protein
MRKGDSDLGCTAAHVKGRPNMAHVEARSASDQPLGRKWTRPMPDAESRANSTSGVRQMPPP